MQLTFHTKINKYIFIFIFSKWDQKKRIDHQQKYKILF